MNKINENRKIDDILINHKNIAKLDLSGKDYMIMMGMVLRATVCSMANENAGQTVTFASVLELEKEGIKKSSIDYTIKKLLNFKIIIKDNDNLCYQFNPNYIWIPSNPSSPTLDDKMSYNLLKNIFDNKK